jgi:hypothetical protein
MLEPASKYEIQFFIFPPRLAHFLVAAPKHQRAVVRASGISKIALNVFLSNIELLR